MYRFQSKVLRMTYRGIPRGDKGNLDKVINLSMNCKKMKTKS